MLGVEIAAALVVAYMVLLTLDPIGGPWLAYWHGEGEAHQYQFYRCHACRRLVTYHIIRSGGCTCHESSKISPTKLGLLSKARLLYVPWSVTSTKARRESVRRIRWAEERDSLERMVKS
jgi:hypothetical protein